MTLANQRGYDRIIVLTDGQWHYPSTDAWGGYAAGSPTSVSPAPLTDKAYLVNVEAYKNAVGSGKWRMIDGWSEGVLEYIRASESILA